MMIRSRFVLLIVLVIIFSGAVLATGNLFEPEGEGEQEWVYTGHSNRVVALISYFDGHIYSAGWDDEVHKLNSDGTREWAYTDHSDSVYAVTVDSDGNIYSSSADSEVHKINTDGTREWAYTDHSDSVYAVTVDSEGNIYSGDLDGEIHKLNSVGTQEWTYTNHSGRVNALTVDSEGNIYSAGHDDELHKINPDGTQEWVYTGHSSSVYAVTVDSEGNIYSGGYDNEVHKINSDGTQEWAYTNHSSRLLGLISDSDGNIYSSSADSEVHKINSDGTREWAYLGHSSNVYGLTVDSEGNIYSGDLDGEVHKLSFATPPEIQDLTISPNEKDMVSGDQVDVYVDVDHPEEDRNIESVEVKVEDSEGRLINNGFEEMALVDGITYSLENIFEAFSSRSYIITVRATDDMGDTVSESMSLEVENRVPEIVSSSFVPSDFDAGDTVGVEIEAFDPDGMVGILDVKITVMKDDGETVIDSIPVNHSSGNLYSINDLFVVEDTEVEYIAEFSVDDQENITTATVTNFVGNVAPNFVSTGFEPSDAFVNDTVNITASVEDPDGVLDELDVSVTVTDENGTVLVDSQAMSFEGDNQYRLDEAFTLGEEHKDTVVTAEFTAEDDHESRVEVFEFVVDGSSDDGGSVAPPPSSGTSNDGNKDNDDEIIDGPTDQDRSFVDRILERVSGLGFLRIDPDVGDGELGTPDDEEGDSSRFDIPRPSLPSFDFDIPRPNIPEFVSDLLGGLDR